MQILADTQSNWSTAFWTTHGAIGAFDLISSLLVFNSLNILIKGFKTFILGKRFVLFPFCTKQSYAFAA